MCHYLFLADVDGPRWTLMGIVVKMAQSVRTFLHKIALLSY